MDSSLYRYHTIHPSMDWCLDDSENAGRPSSLGGSPDEPARGRKRLRGEATSQPKQDVSTMYSYSCSKVRAP
jgi:hypothetical protein